MKKTGRLIWSIAFAAAALRPLPALAATSAFIPPMPLISSGRPAHALNSASGYAASAANTSTLEGWKGTTVATWLAYDLSGVPVAQRGQVVLSWSSVWAPPVELYGQVSDNIPEAYVIETNPA